MIDLAAAARAIGATLEGVACACAVTTDSREVHPGELFVALAGERFDGHAFVEQAFGSGAVAAMVAADRAIGRPSGKALLRVDQPLDGLARLAAWWRGRFMLPMVAVTGSNGKSTVKEMVAGILRAAAGSEAAVLATQGNLNNHIGVPLTLLRLSAGHRYAVVEMGMSRLGEISMLTHLASPTVAVVTNAAPAHLEGLGTLADIARAKGEIFEGLSDDGVAVVNVDDPFSPLWRSLAGRRTVIGFGQGAAATVSGQWREDAEGSELALDLAGRREQLRLAVPGAHNARNALAAAACALGAGVQAPAIVAGLAAFRGVKGRLQRKAGHAGSTVIDDTYNANPGSLAAAVEVLARRPGRRVLALGDMRELGPGAAQLHRDAGELARAAGIDALYATGELMAEAVAAFGGNGRHFDTAEALARALLPTLGADVTVLVKGSRSMRMERVVAMLVPAASPGGGGH